MNFGMPKTAFNSTNKTVANNVAIEQAQRRVAHYQSLVNQFGATSELIQARERAMQELERLQA
jgi:hypothetical protein